MRTPTPYPDQDGDGFPAGTDCDDTDDTVYPGADEACDGVDNDCDQGRPSGGIDEGVTTLYYQDLDGDGYGNTSTVLPACTRPDGYTTERGDCQDNDETIYPGAPETCNGIDDDCDEGHPGGGVDEGLGDTYYRDQDADGYGDSLEPQVACEAPEGYAAQSGDCLDTDDQIHPGAQEVCNHIDDDCDSAVDEGVELHTYYQDVDLDGYGSTTNTNQDCVAPSGYVSVTGDCNDNNESIHPGAIEDCEDSIDQDCSGPVDGEDPSCAVTGYAFGQAPDCGGLCYYDEPHNIAVNGAGQGENTSGYDQYAPGQLTDGFKGADSFSADLGNGQAYEWVGWSYEDVAIYIQFGTVRTFSQVTIGMSNVTTAGIHQPEEIQIFFSEDGTNWDTVSVFSFAKGNMPVVTDGDRGDLVFDVAGNIAQKLKVYFFHSGQWTFVDEIGFR